MKAAVPVALDALSIYVNSANPLTEISLPQARKCFEENSALSPHNITTELERYVSWPGQALGYKIGEIEFRRLRAKATAALGERFDVRDFHTFVLGEGAMPLDLLATRIDGYNYSQGKPVSISVFRSEGTW